MPIPSQPTNLFPRPFASEGNFALIPDDKPAAGRASCKLGFPDETQKPLCDGGVAPNRTDFNGMLYMLSAFAFWQQSGGIFTYFATLNYAPPAVVFYNGKLWWCVAENGPESAAKVKIPGTDDSYWIEFMHFLSGGSSSMGNPVGTIINYYGTTAPNGYLACDGSTFSATAYPLLYALLGKTTTPDMRGLFVRGYDPIGVNDANGVGRILGSYQGDAIRNISGRVVADAARGGSSPTGPFYHKGSYNCHTDTGKSGVVYFDASRQVPTAKENRPKNMTLLYCIKHD